MSDFKDALTAALQSKQNDINSFSWVESNGDSVLMMEMSENNLRKAYRHCREMLINKDKHHPGKLELMDYVNHTYDNCNAELLCRYILYDTNIPTLKSRKDILEYITAMRRQNNLSEADTVKDLMDNLPIVFQDITIKVFTKACLKTLNVFNKRKLISDKFIVSLGLWFTDDELQDLTEYETDGTIRNRLDVIKERLFLNNVRLKLVPNGLSYSEFRSLIVLKNIMRYSDMPTATLMLLRDKITLLAKSNLNYHIDRWSSLLSQIELVATERSINLNEN